MENIALFGYSGHAFVIIDAIKENGDNIVGYFDQSESLYNPYKLAYLGDEQIEANINILKGRGVSAFVSIGNNLIRKKLLKFLKDNSLPISKVIHPSSIISNRAALGEGVFVAAGAKINSMAVIGIGTILNTGCIIEHECSIADYVHVAPGAVLAGNVIVGEGSFVGANAVIKQGIRIGSNAMIGAGAVVLSNVPSNQTWVGNPAKEIRSRSF